MADRETADIRRIRRQIDTIDRRLVELLNERARLGIAVGAAKRAAGRDAIRDRDREAEVLAHVVGASAGPLPDREIVALYSRLMAATRRLEAAARQAALTSSPGDAGES